MKTELKVGDKVEVYDIGLMQLHSIMKQFQPNAKPNNLGWVDEIMSDGTIMVLFPIGDKDPKEHSQVAPYPSQMVARKEW